MYFEDFTIGQKWSVSGFRMDREKIIEFGREYDPLPFHVDEEAGKLTRFGGLIASGPQTFMTFWARFLREHNPFKNELIAGMSNHMEWPRPTYPNDVLHGEVEIVALEPRNPFNGIVEVAVFAYNQSNDLVMTGGAKIVIARRN